MKKTLVLADGIVAKIFIQKVLSQYFSNNPYIIVAKDCATLPDEIPDVIESHILDYTSKFRISEIFSSDIQDIFIIVENAKERFVLYRIIRELSPKTRIVLYNNHEFTTHTKDSTESATILREDLRLNGENDTNLVVIDSENLVANRLTQRLANVPLIPRGFGLEQGEIMEIVVPPGSIFTYRHIGSIQQRKWKIVGIYRAQEFILSTNNFVIYPNDVLLVVGESKVLAEIYRLAKSDIGQFPSPFGRDIFLYVDLAFSSSDNVFECIEDALFLHKHLKNNKLFIQVLNPTNPAFLEQVKSIECEKNKKVQVNIIYDTNNLSTQIQKDSTKRPGLIVINNDIFALSKNRATLYKCALPVLKVGTRRLSKVKKSFLIVGESLQKSENIASVMFDISKQLNIALRFYDFDPDSAHQHDIISHIENVAKVFKAKPEILYSSTQNPITLLNQSDEVVLQFMPFDVGITKNTRFAFFSMDSHRLSLSLEKNPQIFIPLDKGL